MCDFDMDSNTDFDMNIDIASDADLDVDTDFDADLDSMDDSFPTETDEYFDVSGDLDEFEFTDNLEGMVDLSDNIIDSLDDLSNVEDEWIDIETINEYDMNDFENEQELLIDESQESLSLDSYDNLVDNTMEEVGLEISDEEGISLEETAPLEDLDGWIDSTDDIHELNALRDFLTSGRLEENIACDALESISEELPEEHVCEINEETSEETDILMQETLELGDGPSSRNETEELSVWPEEILADVIKTTNDPENLRQLRDQLTSGCIAIDMNQNLDEDAPKILIRDITPDVQESYERDTKETLENYRENLQEYGVDDDSIADFIVQEREKIDVERQSARRGDTSSNIYYHPLDWEAVSDDLTQSDAESIGQGVFYETEEEPKELASEIQELDINYDEIYENIHRESLEQGFEDKPIDIDPQRLDQALENFDSSTWEELSLQEQKDTMNNLADYVIEVIGLDHPPAIEYYNNPQEGEFGGYDPSTNILRINEYMLNDSEEAADTVAHELWHAYQHECAENPKSAHDYQYQYNFENYIPPELNQKAYEDQLVEAEARAFALQFKNRLSLLHGRM